MHSWNIGLAVMKKFSILASPQSMTISISRHTILLSCICTEYWYRSSPLEMFLGKGVLKICSRFPGEHLFWSVISIKLQSNFIEIVLRYGCSPVNYLHNFITPFRKNTSGGVLLTDHYKLFLLPVVFQWNRNIKTLVLGLHKSINSQ